jgi:hypothetical protein
VAYCACDKPLYIQRKTSRPHAYYYCASKTAETGPCPHKSWIRSDLLESVVAENLLDAVGNVPHRVKDVKPAEDHSTELAEVREAIANLESDRYERGLFRGDDGARRYAAMMARLETRLAALDALPRHGEITEWVETGQTFAEHWSSLTSAQRHTYLINAGVKVSVVRAGEDDSIPKVIVESDDKWRKAVESAGGSPVNPDLRGRVLTVVRAGWKVTIHLGDVAELRELAAKGQ